MYSNSPNQNQSTRRLDMPTDHQHPSPSNFVFALAYELKQYLETNAEGLDPDTYDNISYWRGGILSKRAISDEDLSEIIEYIGAEKLRELIELASSKTTSFNN